MRDSMQQAARRRCERLQSAVDRPRLERDRRRPEQGGRRRHARRSAPRPAGAAEARQVEEPKPQPRHERPGKLHLAPDRAAPAAGARGRRRSLVLFVRCSSGRGRADLRLPRAPLMSALPEGAKMIATGVITPFMVPMKVTALAAFLVALPLRALPGLGVRRAGAVRAREAPGAAAGRRAARCCSSPASRSATSSCSAACSPSSTASRRSRSRRRPTSRRTSAS